MCGTNTASCSGRSRYGTSTASDGRVTGAPVDPCPILRTSCRQLCILSLRMCIRASAQHGGGGGLECTYPRINAARGGVPQATRANICCARFLVMLT